MFFQNYIEAKEDNRMTEEERHESIVNAALDGVTIRVEYVTPDKAREILLGNTNNRNLRPRHVEAMARDLSKGEFIFNGEPVRIDKKGVLLDGQNRLHAIIKSKCGAPLLIIEGLPQESQEVTDVGARRSQADVLKLRGEKHCAVLASTLRAIVALDRYGLGGAAHAREVTNPEVLVALEENPYVRECIATCYSRYAAAMTLTTPTITCFLYFLFSSKDRELADDFFEGLSFGAGLGLKDPRLTLRTKMQVFNAGKSRPRANVVVFMVLRAWSAFRNGQTLERIAVPAGKIKNWPEV